MFKRFRTIGIVLALIGLGFVAAGGFAFMKTQEGYKSLNAFSTAQNVTLSYNEQGQLVDRGETAEAESIMSLLKNDWGYPVNQGDLNPKDPIVNTASEYMYQMATIAYHTLHSTVTVNVPADVEYNGKLIKAGDYEVAANGRYWTGFDRLSPIDGPARAAIWSDTAHALIAELGVGTATASALQLGLAIAALFAGLGATLIFAGAGLVWATRPERVEVPELRPVALPA
ncbi:MAG TPA: hypothetical protein VFH98_02030 [Candidatus Limnocylindria bacterium]|nr:hypothetical protein [Candidatus Limnocylindria bacterium]